jgi:hypothetical protein
MRDAVQIDAVSAGSAARTECRALEFGHFPRCSILKG